MGEKHSKFSKRENLFCNWTSFVVFPKDNFFFLSSFGSTHKSFLTFVQTSPFDFKSESQFFTHHMTAMWNESSDFLDTFSRARESWCFSIETSSEVENNINQNDAVCRRENRDGEFSLSCNIKARLSLHWIPYFPCTKLSSAPTIQIHSGEEIVFSSRQTLNEGKFHETINQFWRIFSKFLNVVSSHSSFKGLELITNSSEESLREILQIWIITWKLRAWWV